MQEPSTAIYTSKIIKAGALLDDTKTLLAYWDSKLTVRQNLNRFRNENIFGKATRSRIEDILVIFRQRYIDNPNIIKGLQVFVANPNLSESTNRVLYFFAAKNDQLLYDAVTEFITSKKRQGFEEISVGIVINWINQLVENDKTSTKWSDNTILRCSQELLSTMRDFGVLIGANIKKITPFNLPLEAFLFIAFYLYQKVPSGDRLIHHPDWNLFFLTEKMVETFLMEAHQYHLLEYYVAGQVTRLNFPATNIEEYARVISERTY